MFTILNLKGLHRHRGFYRLRLLYLFSLSKFNLCCWISTCYIQNSCLRIMRLLEKCNLWCFQIFQSEANEILLWTSYMLIICKALLAFFRCALFWFLIQILCWYWVFNRVWLILWWSFPWPKLLGYCCFCSLGLYVECGTYCFKSFTLFCYAVCVSL